MDAIECGEYIRCSKLGGPAFPSAGVRAKCCLSVTTMADSQEHPPHHH